MNTLHFGQKAKHVKTKVNVNEISQANSANNSMELEKANSVIAELKDRLKLIENQMIMAPPMPKPSTEIEEETKDGQ